MGEKKLQDIISMDELIERKVFDSVSEIYNTPDEVLPRVRRAGKIIRPLRFYVKDVERLLARPRVEINTPMQIITGETFKPTITFKKRRR